MAFDHMNTIRIEVIVNGYKYPEEDVKCDFRDSNEKYPNPYQRFLQLRWKHKNVDSGTIDGYNDFKILQPLFCFDVSKPELIIYRSGSTANIEIKLLLDQVPANPFNIYCVLLLEIKAIRKV